MLKKLFIVSAWAMPCLFASANPLQAKFDPEAQYSIVEISGSRDNRLVITQRAGISGISFSARQFDCTNRTVRFMGSSNSLEALPNAAADEKPTPIFKGSLSRAISESACEKQAAPNSKQQAILTSDTRTP